MMKTKRFLVIFWIGVSFSGTFPIYGVISTGFTTGTIIDNVVCLANSEQSYALYLPTGYTVDKKWPIIYAFDAGARGTLPLRHFKPAAEKYGYIIVGSNNARNGPWEPIAQAATAMWQDTRNRLSIDNNRIYATGFSGGSRVASTFTYIVKHSITGIIGCGAGLNTNIKPGMIKPVLYFGLVGLSDFNYREMMQLDKDFDHAGVVHRVLVFEGEHKWPPEEYCTQAVEWMEMNAIKQGLKEKNAPLANDLYKKALDRAQQLEQSQNIFLAVSAYEAGQQLFNGLPEVNEFKNKAHLLRNSKAYKQFKKNEKKRNKKEIEFINIFIRVFARLKNSSSANLPRLETVLRDLNIRYLQKEANKTGERANIYNRSLARRLLTDLRIKASGEGNGYIKKGDFRRAGIFLEIALRAGNEHPNLLYNLACLYSKARNKKKALDYLQKAVKKGFTDFELIKKDRDLDFIRQEKEFKEIVRKIND